MAKYEKYYEEVQGVLSSVNSSLSEEEKSVVLFRIGLEQVSNAMGVSRATYMMSQLLTTTLGIISEDESVVSDQQLHEVPTNTQH